MSCRHCWPGRASGEVLVRSCRVGVCGSCVQLAWDDFGLGQYKQAPDSMAHLSRQHHTDVAVCAGSMALLYRGSLLWPVRSSDVQASAGVKGLEVSLEKTLYRHRGVPLPRQSGSSAATR